MGLLRRLLDDHQAFRALGQALEAQVRTAPAARNLGEIRRLAAAFQERLDAHSALEDRVLYPAVRAGMAASASVNAAFMNHLDNEHHRIDGYLRTLLEQVGGPEVGIGWEQTFALFSLGLRAHLRKEEDVLFPEAERLLGADLLSSPDVGAP